MYYLSDYDLGSIENENVLPEDGIFDVETDATKYANSVSVLYYANGKFIFGEIYKQSISLKSLKGSIAYIKGLIGDATEAIIKVNH